MPPIASKGSHKNDHLATGASGRPLGKALFAMAAFPLGLMAAMLSGCGGGVQFCQPDAQRCYDWEIIETCASDGTIWNREYCEIGEICSDGECVVEPCEPGEIFCLDSQTAALCLDDGQSKEETPCESGTVCVDGECAASQSCTPGDTRCADSETVEQCSDDGSAWEVLTTCEYGTTGVSCFNGECMDLCSQSELSQSYIGCEYFAVDLHNEVDMTYAVVVSNTNDSLSANVTLSSATGVVAQATIPAGQLDILEIRQSTYSVLDSELSAKALRLSSTVPITAYQFNPLDNTSQPYSNDASLLLPTVSLGQEYYVMARHHNRYQELFTTYDFLGSMTVVAVEPGVTNVTIQPTFNVKSGSGVPSLNAGDSHTFQLEQFDLVNLETKVDQQDPTGTWVSADKPVAVFGGSPCSFIPDDVWACDHLEEQIFPLQSWGTHMVAPKTYPRRKLLGYNGIEDDYWQFLAAEDNTVIVTDPVLAGTPLVLQAGEMIEIGSNEDFVAYSDKPFLLGQFLVGEDDIATSVLQTGIGDPAFMLIPPTEQYRDQYIILVPEAYANNFASIFCKTGTVVSMNGSPISQSEFEAVGDGEYSRAWVDLSVGVYHVDGDGPFGIMVYGYDQYVSYGYAGGLNLQPINTAVLE